LQITSKALNEVARWYSKLTSLNRIGCNLISAEYVAKLKIRGSLSPNTLKLKATRENISLYSLYPEAHEPEIMGQ
jgi:hypothetical protein